MNEKDQMNKELDDADLNSDDEPESRGPAGEYIPYVRARSLLAERLGASPQEMAMWTWLGKDHHGKPAGGIDGYLDPGQYDGCPPRFRFAEDNTGNFDYLPQLMACYYRKEEVEAFEPEDRYLTFDRVVARLKRVCSEREAVALVRTKANTGGLSAFHPQTGGTAEAWGDEEGFPPLEQGLFLLAEVQAIEAECADAPPKAAVPPRREGFVPLNELLDRCWDLPMAELSQHQREIMRGAFSPFAWDTLTEEQRRVLAMQVDRERDPVLAEDRARDWDEATVDWRYWRELPTLSATQFIALRHLCDPRTLESQRDIFPGGETPPLGQRVDDDLRRIDPDLAVANKKKLTLRQVDRLGGKGRA